MAKNTVSPEMTSPNQINAGTRIEGQLVCDGNIRIDGDLKGKIECKGKVVIGSTSHIEGDIYCTNADILGKVSGNVYVTEKISLKASCVLNGNIQTGALSIEPGARFNGKCQMGNTPMSADQSEPENLTATGQ